MKKNLSVLVILSTVLLTACNGVSDYPMDTNYQDNPTNENVNVSHENNHSSQVNIGNIISFGDIEWRILDIESDRKLVISEYILELRPFNNTQQTTSWENSDIRTYLNNEFINNNFTDTEQARIHETPLITNNNPWFNTDGGNNTVDRVFLLSLDEIVHHFGDSGELLSPRYAHAWGFQDQYGENRVAYSLPSVVFTDASLEWRNLPVGSSFAWWLRSPGSPNVDMISDDVPNPLHGQIGMTYVMRGGTIGDFETMQELHNMTFEEWEHLEQNSESEGGGIDMRGVYVTKILGVRPAMWINK